MRSDEQIGLQKIGAAELLNSSKAETSAKPNAVP